MSIIDICSHDIMVILDLIFYYVTIISYIKKMRTQLVIILRTYYYTGDRSNDRWELWYDECKEKVVNISQYNIYLYPLLT